MRFIRVLALVTVAAGVFAATAAALRFSDASYFTPVGTVGVPYGHQFNGEGGCGPALPYQYKILNGSLPPGLSLSSSGLISGTPTAAGSFSFWVQLSDEDPPSRDWCRVARAEREFTITIQRALTIQQNAIPAGTRGTAYDVQLTADGGGTHQWSVQSGTLPAGVAFDPATQHVSGTPTAAGDYQFVVRVTDGSRVDTETLVLSVREPLVITQPKFASSEVGVAFEGKVEVTGGLNVVDRASALRARTQAGSHAAYTLAITGLPRGLTADPAGAITGTPLAGGTFQVTINASDPEGRTATLVAPLVVAPKLAITTKRLKNAKAGRPYRAAVKTRGGVTPLKWAKLVGRLPVGLRFDRKNGVFFGTAKKPGTYAVTVKTTDALKVTSEQALTLTLLAPPPKPKPKSKSTS
jgi:hypothetical protein